VDPPGLATFQPASFSNPDLAAGVIASGFFMLGSHENI
jgi:hypothetical protein